MRHHPSPKSPFSTGTQRTHSVFRGPPVRTRLRRAHSASRAYGEGHGSKRQRLYPPLHRGKPYRSRWEALLPTHREHSTKARHTASFAPTAGATAASGNDCILRSTGKSPTKARWKFYVPSTGSVLQKQAEKYIRLQVPSLRHEQARSGRTASFAPTARATAANGNDCILRSTGESPTEADGKPYCPPTGSTPQRPGTQRLSRLRRGPRQQAATIASSAPQGKVLQKRDGSFMSHPQGAFCKSRRKSI